MGRSGIPPTVVVTDRAWSDTAAEDAVLAAAGARVLLAETGEEDELERLVVEADAILTCFKRVSARVIEAADALAVIGRYGVGVDNIDVAAATRRRVIVTNVPTYCTDEVAEHVFAMVFAHCRGLLAFDQMARAHAAKAAIAAAAGKSRRIAGPTMGVVGFGHIGQAVVARAIGLGMAVLVHDPLVDPQRIVSVGATPVDLDTLARRSDVVTLHVPLVPATVKMVDAGFLSRMREGAFLINAARGGVVDLDALAVALSDGAIAGAGLDVTDPEPLPADHPLRRAPNTILTPHVAFSSRESLRDLQTIAANNVVQVLHGVRPAPIVNPTALEHERWEALR